jgi:hypothetical protein
MKIGRMLCGVLILLPVVVGVQKERSDSLLTDLTFGAGAGSYGGIYYTRHYSPASGCDGGGYQYIEHRKKIDFNDLGFGIETQLSRRTKLGLRTGFVKERRAKQVGQAYEGYKFETKTTLILNPHYSVAWKYFGLGLGPLLATKGLYYPSSDPQDYGKEGFVKKALFSYHLRLGNPKTVYASVSHLENVPLISGGGYLNYGLGSQAIPRVSVWLGRSSKPFDEAAWLLKLGASLSPRWSVHSAYRSGETRGEHSSKRIEEKAFSIKLSYRFFRK